MVFVYIRIYYAAKARARRGIRKAQANALNRNRQHDRQVTSFSTSGRRTLGGSGSGSGAGSGTGSATSKSMIQATSGGHSSKGGGGGGPATPSENGGGCSADSEACVTVEAAPPLIPNITCDFASDLSTSDAAEQSQDAGGGCYLEPAKDTLKVYCAAPPPRSCLSGTVTVTTDSGPSSGGSSGSGASAGASAALALQHRGSVLSVNGEVSQQTVVAHRCRAPSVGIDTDMVSEFDPSSSDSGVVSRCAVVKPLKLRLCQPIFGRKTTSKTKREVIDMGKMSGGLSEVSSAGGHVSAGRGVPPSAAPAPVGSPEPLQSPRPSKPRDPEREKRRLARKKEKRATLILGLIMGSFIACWFPFFFLYILTPLCAICNIPSKAFAIAFWLGYMNSVLNPVIYTVFNKDFRRAFRRILFK